jgi:hypothetical protein
MPPQCQLQLLLTKSSTTFEFVSSLLTANPAHLEKDRRRVTFYRGVLAASQTL